MTLGSKSMYKERGTCLPDPVSVYISANSKEGKIFDKAECKQACGQGERGRDEMRKGAHQRRK